MPARKPEPPSAPAPTLQLELGGRPLTAAVKGLQREVLRLTCPAGSLREVPVGGSIALALAGDPPTELSGLVQQWRQGEHEDQLRVALELDDVGVVEEAIRRQRATRIAIQGERAVRVAIETVQGEVAVETALLNISEKGLGLLVRFEDDRALAAAQAQIPVGEAWTLHVSLVLPGNAHELRLACRVVYRSAATRCVKYGLQIDEPRTRSAFPAQQSVAEHMMRYQQSLLQRRAA